jgi:beta-amylase
MRSFHMEFRNLSEEGLISAIEIGLGASGQLRYPSCPERMGWKYPGIGEFQVFTCTYTARSNMQGGSFRNNLQVPPFPLL